MIYLIFIIITIASWWVQHSLTSRFEKYSRIPLDVPMAGRDVALLMLQQNGINDVRVQSVGGTLSDFFNPTDKTVNLSNGVFAANSVAAAAVAAHECGHAVQHRTGYSMLQLRTKLVPAVSFASKWVTWILLGGILLVNVFPYLLYVGVALFAMTTLFSFVTLPVEVDASRRATQWLETAGIVQGQNLVCAKDALKWAAYTYVVAALGSLATLVYYLLIAFGGSRR